MSVDTFPAEVLKVGVKALMSCPREDDTVLIIRRINGGEWTLPGGGVKLGETLEEAVGREIEEEAGIKLGVNTPINLLGLHYFRLPSLDETRTKTVARVVVTARAASSEVRIDSTDHDAYMWVPRSNIGKLALEPTLTDFLPRLMDEAGSFRGLPVSASSLLVPAMSNQLVY